MADENTTLDIIKKLICEHTGESIEEIKESSKYFEDLEFDSLDFVEYVMLIEEHYELEIDDETAEQLTTVGETVRIVDALVAAKKR